MKFLTLLHLVYGGWESAIAFPSAKTCGDSMMVIVEELERNYDSVYATCTPTSVLTESPKPRRRP